MWKKDLFLPCLRRSCKLKASAQKAPDMELHACTCSHRVETRADATGSRPARLFCLIGVQFIFSGGEAEGVFQPPASGRSEVDNAPDTTTFRTPEG